MFRLHAACGMFQVTWTLQFFWPKIRLLGPMPTSPPRNMALFLRGYLTTMNP